ncbi:MAG: nuclear transport factor 2 family protein, partial [Candidatus Binataceae bacterium]
FRSTRDGPTSSTEYQQRIGGAPMDKSLADKVEELWSREQIKSLTYAYGECILRRDAQGMANLFIEDASVDFTSAGMGVHQGRDAIAKHYASTWPRRVRPFFTNHYIEFDGKDRAKGWCWFDNRARRGELSTMGCGKAHDEYRRVDGQWRFASRRIESFFSAPLNEGWARKLD